MNPIVSVFLILITIALILVVGEAVRIGRYLSISKRGTRSITKYENLDPAGNPRILFLGDSYGYGSGTSHSRYSIVGRLGADYPHAYIENYSGHLGFLEKMRRFLQVKLLDKDIVSYDLVIIMVGGMDLTHGIPLWLVRQMLRKVITLSKKCASEVLLIAPNNAGGAPLFRYPLSAIFRSRSKKFDALYRTIADEEHIHFISLYREHADELIERSLFSPDKTHPNDEGYSYLYNQIRQAVRPILPV